MIRAIGFCQGLRGDLVMSTVAARSFKEQSPDSHLTLGLNRQFKDLAPLFHDHPHYDAVHIYDTYDGWPGPRDRDYLAAARYDYVFSAMPQHRDQRWWEHRHQYAEVCHMVDLPIPADLQPRLNRWFNLDPSLADSVAIAPFGGNGGVNDKQLSVEQAQYIVDQLEVDGVKVVQLGAPNEPTLEGRQVSQFCGSYFDAVRTMLSCRLLIHCDTGMGHVAGAYNQRSVGLYGHRYFGADHVKQIMPVHPEFQSVVAPTVGEIDLDKVTKMVKLML